MKTRLNHKDKERGVKISNKTSKHISPPIEEEREKEEISLKEIIEDQRYQALLYQKIEKLKEIRRNRESPGKDRRWRRDIYDRIEEENQMNHTFFLEEIGGIWNKRSRLSFKVREFIKLICEEVLEEWLIEYQEKKKEGEKKNIK